MSAYWINKVCHLTQVDRNFRAAIRQQPEHALMQFPLTDEERDAFLQGDVARLYQLGGHSFLLNRLPRFGALGLDRATYQQRMSVLLTDEQRQEVDEKSRIRDEEMRRNAEMAAALDEPRQRVNW